MAGVVDNFFGFRTALNLSLQSMKTYEITCEDLYLIAGKSHCVKIIKEIGSYRPVIDALAHTRV